MWQDWALFLIQSPIPQSFFIYLFFFLSSYLHLSHSWAPPQAVVDLLVMRELLWSEARSVIFSFMQDCFSSISISAGRHQQHRQDYGMKKRNERDCEARFPLFLSVFFFVTLKVSWNIWKSVYTPFSCEPCLCTQNEARTSSWLAWHTVA